MLLRLTDAGLYCEAGDFHVDPWAPVDRAVVTHAHGDHVADVRGVRVSLHPAGHIRGSAQVRLEHGGEVWVVSGDYETDPDPTCTPFEPVRCPTFVTESTFGLPIYRWCRQGEVLRDIIPVLWCAGSGSGGWMRGRSRRATRARQTTRRDRRARGNERLRAAVRRAGRDRLHGGEGHRTGGVFPDRTARGRCLGGPLPRRPTAQAARLRPSGPPYVCVSGW